jgi:hypothetical protein
LQGLATDAFYRIRDVDNDTAIIPFDSSRGSTRLSSDSDGMFFSLDMSNLVIDRSYLIDIMLLVGGAPQYYFAASPVFKVVAAQ